MKISKRILGVALALIMIFNVFAVGTFAAFPDDTAVKLMISTDKAVYAPGEEVVLTFSEQVIAEVGNMLVGGQYEIGYDTAVLAPYSTSTTLSDHGFVDIMGGSTAASVVQSYTACLGNGSWIDATCEANYGWDSLINYVVIDDGSVEAAATDEPLTLFTVKMKIADDAADGTYTIGFNPGGYEGYNAYSNDTANGGLYGVSGTDYGYSVPNMYEYGTCTFTVSSAPAVEVTHVGEQAKWNGGDANNTAENYLFGFLGQVTGLTVETEAQDGHDVVTNINNITATAAYNGTTVTSEVITMWAVDGGYQFRAVFAGFDPADTKEVSVTFAITMSDGTTTYATADASVDTPNAIYLAAVDRGMPALAA